MKKYICILFWNLSLNLIYLIFNITQSPNLHIMLSERREKIYKNQYKNEENTEKENNGYVVFNWNIHGTVGK